MRRGGDHASYLINMSPSTTIDLQIPRRYGEEYLWTIQPYRFSVARHIVWLIVKKGTNWSLSLRKCIFIGLTKGVKGFRLSDSEEKSAFTSRDVAFDEDSMLREKSETEDKA